MDFWPGESNDLKNFMKLPEASFIEQKKIFLD